MGNDVSLQQFPTSVIEGCVVAVSSSGFAAHETPELFSAFTVVPPRPPVLTVVGVSQSDPIVLQMSAASAPQEPAKGAQAAAEQKAPRGKVPPDGFRWRKYGRKIVAGQARHYYRCTSHGCEAKRQVMWEDDVAIVMPIGEHTHAKHVPRSKSGRAHAAASKGGDAAAKKQKRDSDAGADAIPVVDNLVELMTAQAKGVEFSARLASPDSADDGFSWIERAVRPGDANGAVTRLRCSLDECVAEKDIVAQHDGQCVVHYRGVHCHPRPLLQLRDGQSEMGRRQSSSTGGSRSGSGSSSSRGSGERLEDIYLAMIETEARH